MSVGHRSAAESIGPHENGVRVFLQLLVDIARGVFGPAANNSGRKVLFRGEVIVNTRTLDTDIGGDLPKAETAKTAELHTPFGGVHDCSFDITHPMYSHDYLLIDRL